MSDREWRWVGMLTLVIAAALSVPKSAANATPIVQSDSRTVVWVDVDPSIDPAVWPVGAVITRLNAQTRLTRMVQGGCVTGASHCIRVSVAPALKRGWFGAGMPPRPMYPGYVRLSPVAGALSARERTGLLMHEFGHARNLAHASTCSSIMFTWIHCGSHLTPLTFTPTETTFLRGQ